MGLSLSVKSSWIIIKYKFFLPTTTGTTNSTRGTVGHEIEDNRGDAEKSGPDWFLDIQGRSVEDTISVLVTALLSAKGSDQQLMTQPWASGRPSPSSQTHHSSCLLHFGNFISFLP
jgi:hypothetical protein